MHLSFQRCMLYSSDMQGATDKTFVLMWAGKPLPSLLATHFPGQSILDMLTALQLASLRSPLHLPASLSQVWHT